MGRNKCFVLQSFAAVDGGAGSDRIEDMQSRWCKAVDVFLFLLHYKKQTPDGGCTDNEAGTDHVSQFKAKWYDKLKYLHTDPQTRYYHTMVHLAEIFGFLDMLLPSAPAGPAGGVLSVEVLARQSTAAPIRAMLEAVSSMATFFHDAIYDSTSSTNEEDSAELFREFAGELKALVKDGSDDATPQACALFDFAVDWVGRYILSTKSHSATINGENADGNVDAVGNGTLNNLTRYFSRHMLAFLDADMAVLAKESAAYDVYADLIRKEYIHVPRVVYCEKRAEVLESFLVDPMSGKTKFVFATDVMRSSYEEKAKGNLRKEIASLKSGFIPCEEGAEDENKSGTDGAARGLNEENNGFSEDTEESDIQAAKSSENKEQEDDIVQTLFSDQLAPGWEAVHDPNSGREYYFNSQTNQTVWDKPVVPYQQPSSLDADHSNPMEESSEEALEVAPASNNENTVKEEKSAEEVLNEKAPLPDGWTSLTDEASGRIYFFNAETGETSWDEPVGNVAHESNVHDLTQSASSDNAVVVSETAPAITAADLFAQAPIADYSRMSDTDAEVNIPTTDGVADDVIADEAISHDTVGEDDVNPFKEEPPSDPFASSAFDQPPPLDDDVAEPNAADVFAAPSPTDGVSPGETAALSSDVDLVDDGSVEDKKKALEDTSPAIPPLPAGWTELFDESSSRVYYYNEESGITSWDRPSASSSGPPDTAENPSSTSSLPIDEGVESSEDIPSADGDYAPVEEKDGVVENASAGAAVALNAQPLNHEQEHLRVLPEGWEQLVDPTSGNPYYFCTIDGTTSWERPVA